MKVTIVFCRPAPSWYLQSGCQPPLGTATVAASLERAGHIVRFLDLGFESIESFSRHLIEFHPNLVGFYVDSPSLGTQEPYTKAVKEILPSALVTAGGPHPSIFPESMLDADSNIKISVIGEGEMSMVDLADAMEGGAKDFSKVGGLVIRTGDGPMSTGPSKKIDDLSSLPWPARHLLPMEHYLSIPPDLPYPYRTTGVLWSRGCFGNCSYCQPIPRKMFGSGVRRREIGDVVDELEFLYKTYKINSFAWNDAEPFYRAKDWQLALADEILRRGLRLHWGGLTRVDSVDRETLRMLKKAGLFTLSFGVESGSPKMLKCMRKGITPEVTRETFRIAKEMGIVTVANFMVGTPGETHETLAETLKLLKQIKPDLIRMAVTVGVPGTDMYRELEEKGMIRLTDWREIDASVIGPIALEHLTDRDIEAWVRRLVRTYLLQLAASVFHPGQLAGTKGKLLYHVSRHFIGMLTRPMTLLQDLEYYLLYARKSTSRHVGFLSGI
ncbi:MAG: radical SAM protein [Deltaproteobacteria bacterium]|nr:radical SAM protein [Deltaproteobacteria bacterium]